ncbi:hypothetical protein PMAC_001118 [Pneumocystis sp. 'macacae']|nr:hypothetical protein PMAC_001118 [Pneumocystis sp. 'macacae']
MTHRFVKLTAENKTGFWHWLRQWLVIDPNRSSGLTRNNQFRKPSPGTPAKPYVGPLNLPASDIAENPYWKRDTLRNYPRLSVITQETLAELLLLGNPKCPAIDEASETSETNIESVANRSLSIVLQHVPSVEVQNMMLTEKGIAPLPGKPYHWLLDQQGGYPSNYSVRTFR